MNTPDYVYSDSQAVGDGVLVPVGAGEVNRVTSGVVQYFGSEAPLMAAIEAILKVPPEDGWRVLDYDGKRLWLVPNEVGGHTLMFPDDW